jgi:hypothetical protein
VKIQVLYYSKGGNTRSLAGAIGEGAGHVDGAEVILRHGLPGGPPRRGRPRRPELRFRLPACPSPRSVSQTRAELGSPAAAAADGRGGAGP